MTFPEAFVAMTAIVCSVTVIHKVLYYLNKK